MIGLPHEVHVVGHCTTSMMLSEGETSIACMMHCKEQSTVHFHLVVNTKLTTIVMKRQVKHYGKITCHKTHNNCFAVVVHGIKISKDGIAPSQLS